MTEPPDEQSPHAYQEARLYEHREFKLGDVFLVNGARIVIDRKSGHGRNRVIVRSLDGKVIGVGVGSADEIRANTSNSQVDDSENVP